MSKQFLLELASVFLSSIVQVSGFHADLVLDAQSEVLEQEGCLCLRRTRGMSRSPAGLRVLPRQIEQLHMLRLSSVLQRAVYH